MGQVSNLPVSAGRLETCPTAETPDQRFEAAVSLAATVCWEWGRHNNDQLFLLVADQPPVIHTGPCTRDRALAMLRRSLGEVP